MTTDTATQTCFIAMPITTHEDEAKRYGDDVDHWTHVMETIHVPAVRAAGFEPIRPVVSGSYLIHGEIIRHLSTADMVLCDLSGLNPNVFFELGVRTSLNLPIALVKDEHFSLPFDTSGINTHSYASSLRGWETPGEITRMSQYLKDSVVSSAGSNPMWRHFGLMIAAQGPESVETSGDARMELMFESVNALRTEVATLSRLSQPPRTFAHVDDLVDSIQEPLFRSDPGFATVMRYAERLEKRLQVNLESVTPNGLGRYDLRYVMSYTDTPGLSEENHRWVMSIASAFGLVVRGIDTSEYHILVTVELIA